MVKLRQEVSFIYLFIIVRMFICWKFAFRQAGMSDLLHSLPCYIFVVGIVFVNPDCLSNRYYYLSCVSSGQITQYLLSLIYCFS